VEGGIAHEHVDELDELVEIVSTRLDESFPVKGVGPHMTEDSADIAAKVEFVWDQH